MISKALMMSIALILLMLWAVPEYALAQDGSDLNAYHNNLRQKYDDKLAEIAGLESKSNLLFALSISVILIGLAIAIVRMIEGKYNKIAVGILAALITAVGTVKTAVYPGDHHSLHKCALQAKDKLDNIDLIFAQIPACENNEMKKELLDEISFLLKDIKIHEIEMGETKGQAFAIELFPSAHAQSFGTTENLPDWINHPPKDRSMICFVGQAESRSLKSAKEASRTDAYRKGAEYMDARYQRSATRQAAGPDEEALVEFFRKAAQVEKTYFYYDEINKVYSYYTLISLDKSFIETDLMSFSFEQSSPLPRDFIAVQSKPDPNFDDYYSQRSNLYNDELEKARKELQPVDYADFIEGRQLRKSGKYEQSLEYLQSTTEKYPGFYMGWYNLALAYQKLDRIEEADLAYRKAISLCDSLAIKDASLYNTYGFFLYQNQKYEDAERELKKALLVEPNHPKATRNLQAVMTKREGPD
jgi:tetratricopeptide (TPR) repeat protein